MRRAFPFHQGRFQGSSRVNSTSESERVSIPPRKVSRAAGTRMTPTTRRVSIPPRKVSREETGRGAESRTHAFPFHQGRFQGGTDSCPIGRHPSFHSTKEGFKADQQRRHPCLFSIAHRCPRSPCRVKRLRAPASKRLCSSPKRASTPRPFRAIGGRRTAYKNILQKYRLLAILSG